MGSINPTLRCPEIAAEAKGLPQVRFLVEIVTPGGGLSSVSTSDNPVSVEAAMAEIGRVLIPHRQPPKPGLARSEDPSTSKEACSPETQEHLRQVVLYELAHAPDGLTTHEIAARSKNERDSISPRMAGLVKEGLVKPLEGKRVPPGRTRASTVWGLVVTETPVKGSGKADLFGETDSREAHDYD